MSNKHTTSINTSIPQKQLKHLIKQNQQTIKNLEASIQQKRYELQNFSKNITKLIQKKIVYRRGGGQNHKQPPKFNPHHKDPQLLYYHNLKQQLYAEIHQLKNKTLALKSTHQPAIINEYHHKQNIIKNLDQQLLTLQKEKNYLEGTMEDNKNILLEYRTNRCISDIGENQRVLEELRKEIKGLDREWNELNTREIEENMFIFQYDNQLRKIQNPQPIKPGQQPVDPSLIQQLIFQIKTYTDQKKQLQKSSKQQQNFLTRNITNLLHDNKHLEQELRALESTRMKKQLELRHIKQKRQKQDKMRREKELEEERLERRLRNLQESIPESFRKNYQTLFNNNKEENVENREEEESDEMRDSMFLTDLQHNHNNQQTKSKTITIADFQTQNLIKDIQSLSLPKNSAIDKVIRLHLFHKESETKLYDLQVVYVDAQGNQHITRGVLDAGKKSGMQERIIEIEEVEDWRYMGDQALGMKFIMRDGQVIEIGQYSQQKQSEQIPINQQNIQQIQYSLDPTLTHISGLLLKISKPSHMKPSHKQSSTNSPIRKWNSTSQASLLTNKKVHVKRNPSKHRNMSDLPKIDHRLLLNRKNKMV